MPGHVRDANVGITDAARLHRKQPTMAEQILWEELRDRRLGGVKFRRQHPLGPFIVDFCCAKERLIVEVDGDSHKNQRDYDDARTQHLSAYGYRVLRFTNDDVLINLDQVLLVIVQSVTPK